MPGAVKLEDLDEIFTYHAPTEVDVKRYEAIRESGRLLARTIIENSPQCADQTMAIRTVREAVAWANAAVALKGAV